MAGDYYATLGVARDASRDEIKKAFRRLARESHPDARPGDTQAEARFREAAEAYEVLSDPQRRAQYDRGATFDFTDLFGGMGSLDDLIRTVFGDSGFFGAPGTATRPHRGRDVLVRARVTLAEAALGTNTSVSFHAGGVCEKCGGDGSASDTSPITCNQCGGSGMVRISRRGILGTMTSVGECDVCHGAGTIVESPCDVCHGIGVTDQEFDVTVEVPPGIEHGTRLRLSGRGESGGRSGAAGDLFVEIDISPDPRFERAGDDLISHITIDMTAAALGTQIDVPLVEGGVETIRVEAGTQPGDIFRLGSRGMARFGRRGRGDLIVQIEVHVPVDLTDEQRSALEQFASMRGDAFDKSRERRRRRRR